MIRRRYAFYGSLKNLEFLEAVVRDRPTKIMSGTVFGQVETIHDPTEPNGVTTYPILFQSGKQGEVDAILCEFEGDMDIIHDLLTEYEGDGYDCVLTTFFCRNGREFDCRMFVGKCSKVR